MKHVRWLIIGAGPTGLSAAYRLLRTGETDILVLERDAGPGGLSASFRDNRGFTWDQGGHVIFSHYSEYERLLDELLPGDSWYKHRRQAWIRLPSGRIPYPFQLHLDWLPEDKRKKCWEGLKAARAEGSKKVENFQDWILTRFGKGIAELFMEPYNRKLWSYSLREMGMYWFDDRVALPPEKNGKAGRHREAWGPNAFFRFPRRGGTGAIWTALADRVGFRHIRAGCEIVRIDTGRHRATAKDGASFSYDYLLSSMPLTELAHCAGIKVPKFLDVYLRPAPVVVVGLGLSGAPPERLNDVTWMYFPDPRTRIYRLTLFSRYSPQNVPDRSRYWSLLLELSSLPEKVDLKQLVQETISTLIGYGLLDRETRVVSRWARYLSHAYPVPTLRREELRPELLKKLARDDIFSRGRFGAWLYEVGNMDHCAMQGMEWVDYMLGGKEEVTINDPQRVNREPGNKPRPVERKA